MNDIRRTILWVVFGFSMILLWDQWQIASGRAPTFMPPPPKAASVAKPMPTDAPAVAASQVNSGVPSSSVPTSTALNAAAGASNLPPAPNAVPAAPARELIDVTTDVYKLKFDPEGGSLVRAELLQQRDIVKKDINMVLLDSSKDRLYNAQSGLIGAAGVPNHKTPMTLVSKDRDLKAGADTLTLRFEATGGDVKLAKIYTLKRSAYDIGVTHEITNTGAAEIKPQLYVQLIRDGNKPAGESDFYSTFTGPVVYSDAKKYQKIEFSDIEKNKADFEKVSTAGYVGMVQH
jgi:YidC/Oxa1 family membrane protein insertase